MTLIPIHYCQIDFQTICQAGIRQDNTNYIHCGRKQLSEVPNFSRTTNTVYDELVLNDNQITSISRNAFQGLRVKRLNLSGNKIRSIDSRAFIELANYLEELIIEFDSAILHEIPNAIRTNLINLRSLKLINLNLTILLNHTFIKYRKLEDLSIIKSNIKSIESNAFYSLNNLRSLHLDHNQLSDSIWFDLTKYLQNLEILTLSQNNFHYLKENFLSKHLKILDLSSNGIQIIEKNFFENLSLLEKLYLQNNEINSLQLTFLTLLKQLKELNLDFNRLTFLPENLFQFNNKLLYLSLQGNDLNYLTNKSFFGLKYLTYLNLARNRLQFQFNQQPFQHLNSLEILNLDRNIQLNLSKNIFSGLQNQLIELSLQNCNLTTIDSLNNPFYLFHKLQRLKLSSNYFQELPHEFLIHLKDSLISIDLQRNALHTIPNLFGKNFNTSKLTDFDLSSNHLCTLDKFDLYQYKNLKTIGLNGNPLHCDCQLIWLKQWLIKNYDYDLIKFLQWTCTTPQKLFGKQLTIIDEQDMICNENEYSKCNQNKKHFFNRSTNTQSTSIKSTTTTTTTTLQSSSSSNELVINDISYNPNGMLTITWEYMILTLPRYIHLQIYYENNHHVILQRLIDGEQRSIEIDIKDYLKEYSSIYMICLNIRHNKYCRNIQLEQIKSSSSLILSSNTQDNYQSLQFFYLLGGICLGAILVCIILIIVCCWRIRRMSREKLSNSIEKLPTNTLYHPPPHSSIFYRPLNIISYPQQQQSCDTSECSIHSSTDTSQIASDSYHIYQQIPSVYNCQIHPTRTHILI
ncbi:unnamed protein product [Adineta steineri]|uniref:LRRCT domain-containing protein n=1 Tax=Adineta steineri TaxID=433720 RepID=A0A818IZI6_9BILA|nr:unnamed protein product [Adineta steineri]CAF3532713.1 unnamed protein product [Adineta steineri]